MLGSNSVIARYGSLIRSFGWDERHPLAIWLDMLFCSHPPHYVEYSIKVEQQQVFPYRLNGWYYQPNRGQLLKILQFFDRVAELRGSQLDLSALHHLVEVTHQQQPQFVTVGFDLRRAFHDSRLKLWFTVQNAPGTIADVLRLADLVDDPLMARRTDESLLFGIDIPMGGGSQVKVYPGFRMDGDAGTRNRKRLEPMFGSRSLALMEKCAGLLVCLRGPDCERVLHFAPASPEQFLTELAIAEVSHAYRTVCTVGLSLRVLSLMESELEDSAIHQTNLYFT